MNTFDKTKKEMEECLAKNGKTWDDLTPSQAMALYYYASKQK